MRDITGSQSVRFYLKIMNFQIDKDFLSQKTCPAMGQVMMVVSIPSIIYRWSL
jgi:hypothetical protein